MTPHSRRRYGDDGTTPHATDRIGRELVGGPLDGMWLDVAQFTEEQIREGFLLMADGVPGGMYEGGRSDYEPREPDDGRLHWMGDVP